MRSWRKRVYFKLKGSRVLMKEIINFIEANVDGKTLFTKELVYELENGALQGVYSDQISFSNLKYSQSGFQRCIPVPI